SPVRAARPPPRRGRRGRARAASARPTAWLAQERGEVEEVVVDLLLPAPGQLQRRQLDVAVDDADHHVGVPLQERLDGGVAEAAGEDAVARRRRAAALDVAEDGHAGV